MIKPLAETANKETAAGSMIRRLFVLILILAVIDDSLAAGFYSAGGRKVVDEIRTTA